MLIGDFPGVTQSDVDRASISGIAASASGKGEGSEPKYSGLQCAQLRSGVTQTARKGAGDALHQGQRRFSMFLGEPVVDFARENEEFGFRESDRIS